MSRDGGDSDQIGAENVVVLHVELHVGDRVGKGDLEVLVPDGALRVGYDACTSHGSSGEADCDVRVAGNDLTVPLLLLLLLLLVLVKERCAAGAECDEA